jgi:hypothetical protein
MSSDADGMRQNWLDNVISSFLSSSDDGEPLGTPEEMTAEAAQKAFTISTSLGLVPGPLGMATILPEVVALAKLHINLIHRIARHHNRQQHVSREIVLLILANVMGVAVGEVLVRKIGTVLVLRSVDSAVAKRVAQKIGSRIVSKAAEKAIGRWIPVLTAPLFGYFSRSLTKKVGREADRIFSGALKVDFSQA